MKVSILIPTFNRENVISETINSALSQTYKNIEIIISDNNSTDSTYLICTKFAKNDKRIKVFQNKTNLGPVLNWRACIENSSGDLVKFLWSDDTMDNNFIEKSVKYFTENEVGFVYSSVNTIFKDKIIENNQIFNKDKIFKSKIFIKESLYNLRAPVSPGCAIFRRIDLQKNLLLNIPNTEELDFLKFGAGNDQLMLLITAASYNKVAYLNDVKCNFTAGYDSISILEGKNLSKYYLWAQRYFVVNHCSKDIDKFKAYLLIHKLRGTYNEIYDSIKINSKPKYVFYVPVFLIRWVIRLIKSN